MSSQVIARVSRALRRVLKVVLKPVIVSVDSVREGKRLYVIPGEHIGYSVLWDGYFDKGLLDWADARLHQLGNLRQVYLDVGGNIGNHVAYFSGSFERILTFEPNPLINGVLRANVAINQLSSVKIFDIGLSSEAGIVAFSVPSSQNLGSGRIVEAGSANSIKIEVARGDDVLRNELVGTKLSFVKVDVEGHESSVLKGLSDVLLRDKPPILVEVRSDTFHSIRTLLWSLGYRYIDIFEDCSFLRRAFQAVGLLPRQTTFDALICCEQIPSSTARSLADEFSR